MIYLDSSALVKLLVSDVQTPALQSFLANHHTEHRVTSALSEVELARALARAGWPDDPVADAARLLAGTDRIALVDDVLTSAAGLSDPTLRCLDAIHLASAMLLDADVVVTYDDRLAAACSDNGLAVTSPGHA